MNLLLINTTCEEKRREGSAERSVIYYGRE